MKPAIKKIIPMQSAEQYEQFTQVQMVADKSYLFSFYNPVDTYATVYYAVENTDAPHGAHEAYGLVGV